MKSRISPCLETMYLPSQADLQLLLIKLILLIPGRLFRKRMVSVRFLEASLVQALDVMVNFPL